MRAFVVVCLFAAASAAPAADAEADPALLYTSGVLPYAGLHHAAYPYGVGAVAPAVYSTAAVKSVVEKPAEVKVDTVAHVAPVVYNTAVHHPLTAYHAGVYAAGLPVAGYYANSGGAVHVVKREADADATADADADADPYYGYYGYNYGYPYAGYRAYAGYPYGYRAAWGYPYWG